MTDPNGIPQHAPGAKLDAGKVRLGLVLGHFSKALWAVGEVGTYGAKKYTDAGWRVVPDGVQRYEDAMLRHFLKLQQGEENDPESGMSHRAHMAWNALAVLELSMEVETKIENSFEEDNFKLGLDTDEDATDCISFCSQILHPMFANKSFTVLVIGADEKIPTHNGPVLEVGRYYDAGCCDESAKWLLTDVGWRPTCESGIITVEAPSVPQDRPDVNHLGWVKNENGWAPSAVLNQSARDTNKHLKEAVDRIELPQDSSKIMPGDYVLTKHDDTPRKVVGMSGDYKSVTIEVGYGDQLSYVTHQMKEVTKAVQ